jgi:hypothetical protein
MMVVVMAVVMMMVVLISSEVFNCKAFIYVYGIEIMIEITCVSVQLRVFHVAQHAHMR